MNCPHCGSPVAESSSFCGECGGRIRPPSIAEAGSSAQLSGAARAAPTRLAGRVRARRRVLVVVGVVIVLAVAGGTFAWFQRSGSPPVTSASHKAATAHIVFLSDQSVILPRPGATYHFVVEVKSATNHVLDEPVQWYSSAPGQVTVTRAGVVTARVATGSAP